LGALVAKSYLILLTAVIVLVLVFEVSSLADRQGAGHEHEEGKMFWLVRFVKPVGVITFGFLIATLLSGLLRRRLGRRFTRVHTTLAVLTLLAAVCHAVLVSIVF
jgi:nitrogen fixation/metabolism regulation signal transduction histidine kinase